MSADTPIWLRGESPYLDLYYHFGGPDAAWFRAIAIVESNEDALAIGDGGLAWGLYQMHEDFWSQWSPSSNDMWSRFCPAKATYALSLFWAAQGNLLIPQRLAAFNLGATGARRRKYVDPAYVEKVTQWRNWVVEREDI